MAIIADRVPPPVPLPANVKRRVVVKFRPDARLTYSQDAEADFARQNQREWSELARAFPGVRLSPYFATIADSLREFIPGTPQAPNARPGRNNFASYFAVDSSGSSPERIAEMISRWPFVEMAYVEAGPVPPPLDPADDPRSLNQGYLNMAPHGVDARWAWTKTDGAGVLFVDMERGWTLDHQDLAAANISIISGISQDFHGHGTAVLGEVAGFDNALGGIGIAPKASTRVVSQWRTASTYNTAEAILSAATAMSHGDVLLLEAQTTYPTTPGYVPVEVEQAVFDAIQFATSQGIVVIEAGANGSVDLDTFEDMDGKTILNRMSPDFRDSGAIMVGAASSAAPHQRLGFSNFGSRIDCYAWGQSIDTCGDGWVGTGIDTYTTAFGGTSGASPIVAGAAVLLQSWRVGLGESRYSPAQLRQLLSDSALNTVSADSGADRIGVMPNLRSIIEHEGASA